ncbi:hypothetical protein EDEG_02021 [Edhazardia aedis USNM 41457]|uniref:Ribosomal RNA small subunit methyltransferase NEP1 n=1 Tax=Edhazardia aedis (strain USNM 41457) TaxID=1003232 RepID=J9DM33_EDHAE|nr:hypothetical protein EDEG_02021 [Edhazardia aedis USNM 41457]|eukprot:EJW03650.1 hypothetical protein EDEG_02021 [Edhazardia aedis USNM 41457]
MDQIVFVICQASLTQNTCKHSKGPRSKRCFNCLFKPNSVSRDKKKSNYKSERTDITHQCLLTLLDSPLNKAGKLKVFIHTTQNALIEVNPATRIPRTLSRFNGLMSQLLSKLKIRAVTGEVLLKVIKNPVTNYLTPNAVRVELCQVGSKINKDELIKKMDRGYVFFVNAIPSGEDGTCEYAEIKMKVSDYGLSAALCCGKVCNIFEEILNIF